MPRPGPSDSGNAHAFGQALGTLSGSHIQIPIHSHEELACIDGAFFYQHRGTSNVRGVGERVEFGLSCFLLLVKQTLLYPKTVTVTVSVTVSVTVTVTVSMTVTVRVLYQLMIFVTQSASLAQDKSLNPSTVTDALSEGKGRSRAMQEKEFRRNTEWLGG